MTRAILSAALLAMSTSCSLPGTVALLQEHSPPPEFGRPGWVRACAGTGAWVAGAVGGVLSVVLLPATYPLSLLMGDSLGPTAREEFLFFPATGLAATGHFLVGGPPDLVDHVFRRAWIETPPAANSYELVPMEPPLGPAAAAPTPAAPNGSAGVTDPAADPARDPVR